jgi:tRNA A58 N-methylase Trm61
LLLRGPLGIGKSTFLAYGLAKLMSETREDRLDKAEGNVDEKNIKRFISLQRESSWLDGIHADVRSSVTAVSLEVDAILMDGCSK